jgi:hypothetical protein
MKTREQWPINEWNDPTPTADAESAIELKRGRSLTRRSSQRNREEWEATRNEIDAEPLSNDLALYQVPLD